MNINKPNHNKEALIQLRKEAGTSSQQPPTLPFDSKALADRIHSTNSKALLCMQQQKWQQALFILEQAERLLQVATTKGLSVQRYLIRCVFHNEACCYQNLWQLEQCSNYIQALIYNFNTNNNGSSSLQADAKNDCFTKYGLAKYYLQFCAVNSQLGNHSGALIAARKALDTIKKEFSAFSKKVERLNSKNRAQHQQKIKLLNIICHFNDNVGLQNAQLLQQCTAYYVQIYKQTILEKQMFSKEIKRKIQTFTIKSVMQIQYLSYENFLNTLQAENSTSLAKIFDMLFLLSTSYFTMATELRILSLVKTRQVKADQKQNHPQFRQSFMYHLYSCLILSLTITVTSPFLQHLLATYHSHYNTDLLALELPYKKGFSQLIFSMQNKNNKQLSIICSEQDQVMGSLISKGSGTLARFTKQSKQSEKEYKFSLIVPKKSKSKSKKKIKNTIRVQRSKGKKTVSSLSKSPSPKSPIEKSQKSKECICLKTTIPSIKQIFGPEKSKLNEQKKKHRQRQKTSLKPKRKGKLEDHINDYFVNKEVQHKAKKSSVSTKKSLPKVKSTGRLPINSTLQAKEPMQIVAKEKKKSNKKSILQHYL